MESSTHQYTRRGLNRLEEWLDTVDRYSPSATMATNHVAQKLLTRRVPRVNDRISILDALDHFTNDQLRPVGSGVDRDEVDGCAGSSRHACS